jgi:hypothetical protein
MLMAGKLFLLAFVPGESEITVEFLPTITCSAAGGLKA